MSVRPAGPAPMIAFFGVEATGLVCVVINGSLKFESLASGSRAEFVSAQLANDPALYSGWRWLVQSAWIDTIVFPVLASRP